MKLESQVARKAIPVSRTNHYCFIDESIEVLSKELVSVKAFLITIYEAQGPWVEFWDI